jgi:uncharacterized protein (DUF1810 family)
MLPDEGSDLGRFVEAQQPVFGSALGEIRQGRKRTHSMWYVFPQIRGLRRSALARRFSLQSQGEALAHANHPLWGQRLRSALAALQDLPSSNS